MPPQLCKYSEDGENRRRNENIAMVTSIVFTLFPLGLSMPVIYKWPLWGVSAISILYLVMTIVPWLSNRSLVQQVAFSIAVIALAFGLFWPLMRSQYKTEKATLLEGDLRAMVKATKTPERVMEVGGTTFVWKNDPQQDVMKMLYDSGLRIEVEDNELKVSGPIRDRLGHLVASLDKNHWSVTSACLDKNYSSDSLEILDLRGLVIFQIKILSDRVQLQGEWRDEFGHGLRLMAGSDGGIISYWIDEKSEQQEMKIIEPMFKYPSANHWSELRSSKN
jgi:hypothetical protein